MKVLFFCEGLNKTSIRAQPWRHVIEISKRIEGLGNEVQIFSDLREESHNCGRIQGLDVKRIKRKGLFVDTNDFIRNFEEDADILNWHGSDTWSSFYLSRLGKCSSRNIVWTLHSGPMSMNDLKNLTIREMLQLYKYWNNIMNAVFPSPVIRKWLNCARIKRIIALSHRLSEYLKTIGVSFDDVSVVRSGVDTKRFAPFDQENARDNLDLPKEAPIILYYGPLSSFRGVDTLVDAAPLIRKKIRSLKLLLLGRGSEINFRFPNNSRESWITVESDIFSEDAVVEYLDAADIVVLPFRFWPQVECPLTLLESMAMQKAVLTTSTGAISEIVNSGENGILAPPGDPLVLAEKATKLLQDQELRRRIGVRARRYVEKYFDWDTIVLQTLDAFEKALRMN